MGHHALGQSFRALLFSDGVSSIRQDSDGRLEEPLNKVRRYSSLSHLLGVLFIVLLIVSYLTKEPMRYWFVFLIVTGIMILGYTGFY